MLKRYLAKGGKILFLLDPPDKAGARRDHRPHGAAQGLGDRGRQQRRGRRQRHGAAARHRARSAGRRQVPAASDHRPLQPADRVSAGAFGGAGRPAGRPASPADAGRDQPATAGPRPTSRRSTAPVRSRAISTRATRPVRSRWRPRCRPRRPTCRAPRRRRQARGQPASRRRGSWCSATPTSPRTAGSASRATATCS